VVWTHALIAKGTCPPATPAWRFPGAYVSAGHLNAGEEGWIESCEADYSFTGSGDDQSGGNGRTGNAGTLVNPLNNMFLGPLLLALAMLLSSEAIGGLA